MNPKFSRRNLLSKIPASLVGILALLLSASGAMAGVPTNGKSGAGAGQAQDNGITAILLVANGKIVFDSDRDGNREIYSMEPNGTNQTRLTNNAALDQTAMWSWDGTKIAFARGGQVFTMNADGTGVVQLTTTGANSEPAWSPDGTQIAFRSNRDGNDEIYKMNANGSNQTRLTNDALPDTNPTWSPNGTRIAFIRTLPGNNEIFTMTSSGAGQTNITNNAAGDFGADWSHDGTQIVFRTDRDGNAEIYRMNDDGSSPTRLTNNTAIDSQPVWSPDGTRIAFESNRDGNFEIYTMTSTGTGQTRITNNTANDNQPDWAPFPPFYVTNTNDSGAGSLRQAILDTNAHIGDDSIYFNIPGAGVHTIQQLSALPSITDTLAIEGTTQPGFADGGGPLIELDGVSAGAGAPGIRITGGSLTLRGLVISRFTASGVNLASTSAGSHIIQGNYIGTDPTGSQDRGNLIGIFIGGSAGGSTIGGTLPAHRNIISGNGTGININNADANVIRGNYIGTDVSGTANLGNDGSGINLFSSAADNIIGGSGSLGNIIAFNNQGITIDASGSTGNQISGNSIHSNTRAGANPNMGIDLLPAGVTANDSGDGDTGPNNLQNFPVLTSAGTTGSSLIVSGSLNSTPNTLFVIEFYSNASCAPSGNGEGQTLLDTFGVVTDLSGNSNFVHTMNVTVPVGHHISATASRFAAPKDTSEFSACRVVTAAPTATLTPTRTPTPCSTSFNFNGSITGSDISLPNRLTQNGDASECGTNKPFPGSQAVTGRHYDQYIFQNNTASSQCVTVSVTGGNCGINHSVSTGAWLGTFNPNNLSQGYRADYGQSINSGNPNGTYSLDVPAGQQFVVVVYDTGTTPDCNSYSLQVSGCITHLAPTATPTPCSVNLQDSGTITAADLDLPNRLTQNGVESECGTAKPFPGSVAVSGRNYDQYIYSNNTATSQCVTVAVTGGSCGLNRALASGAWLGSFNPTNISQNYLADYGQSINSGNPTGTYSFDVPAGEQFVVVVYDTGSVTGCDAYSLQVSGCIVRGAAPTPTRTATATPCPIQTQVTGAITANDPTQAGRLTTGVISNCATQANCPNVVNSDPRHYDAYTYSNTSGSEQCVTITLDATGCGGQFMASATYLGSYNPNNLCQNFLGVHNSTFNGTQSYAVNVPAGQTFVVVVYEASPDTLCPSYTLTVRSCGTIGQPASPTPTATATPNCTLNADYNVSVATGTIVPGTSRIPGSGCNSCVVTINLPFPYQFYGTTYNSVNASNKGVLQFASSNASGANVCLPDAGFNDAIYAYWDDLNTFINDQMGIYVSTQGTAPNRIFTIEWRAGFVSNDIRPRFEVRLYEGLPVFEIIYGTTRGGGFSTTVGLQKGTGERTTQFSCNQQNSVPNGRRLIFDQRTCSTFGPSR